MARHGTRKPRTQTGMLPGESKRRSLVTVVKDTLGADGDRFGRETHNYIVETHRLDGAWTYEVEYRGETWLIPGKVVEAMARHRESIIKAERSARAREQVLRQAEQAAKEA